MVFFLNRGESLSHDLFHHAGEGFGVVLRQGGENLAVEHDLLLCGGTNELGVGVSKRAESGVDLHAPKSAEVVLLVLAVCELIDSGLAQGNLCFDLLVGATITKTFCELKYLAAVFVGCDSSFDA